MKRVIYVNLVVVLGAGLFCSAGYGQPWLGSGTEDDPYRIRTAEDMQAIGADANYWDAHFLLCADIDLGAYTGTSFNIIGERYYDSGWVEKPFTGIFDGDGHVITNFTYDCDGINFIGLFSYIDDPNAEVRDLGLIAPDVNAGSSGYVGALAGYIDSGTINGCYVEGGAVSGEEYVGGLVGYNEEGDITDCYSTSSVTGEWGYVGGLVGYNRYGDIQGCYSTSEVTGEGEWGFVGGLVGYNRYGEIQGCYSAGSVTGEREVGGLVGGGGWYIENCYSTGSVTGRNRIGGLTGGGGWYIENCYSTGSVTGEDYVGGLVGRNGGSIQRCYSTGGVTGEDYVGGLAGKNSRGDIQGCYSTGGVKGELYVGGLVGLSNEGFIYKCYSMGGVWGEENVGGLVGGNAGDISSCYSTGNVTGKIRVGGLVGMNGWSNYIRNCYSTGSVTGENRVGGLLGYNGAVTSTYNCYSTGSVTGEDNVGGLVGYTYPSKPPFYRQCFWDSDVNPDVNGIGNGSDPDVTGLPTVEMQSACTYTFWGCDGNWTIDDGNDYPRLAWENRIGEVIDFGCGTEDDPYLIYKAIHLMAISEREDRSSHFKLMADIDFDGIEFVPIASSGFEGVFDGNGHTVSNLVYDSYSRSNTGLFGKIKGLNAEVKNLGLIAPNIDAGTGEHVGSLVGWFEDGTITNCYVEGGIVTGERDVGGLVGNNRRGKISNCYTTCSVTGDNGVGGLVGENFYYGYIQGCYSTGEVTGERDVGGLVGYDCDLSGCYWANFWDSDVNPDVNGIGNMDDPNVVGLPTVLMQMKSTFVDARWDFDTPIWKMCVLPDYPKLWWQVCPIELEMEFTPAMLNCESRGNWVEAHFVLPEGYLPEDVDVDVPAVAEPIGLESVEIEVLDEGNGYYRIVAVFDREGFCEALGGDIEKYLEVVVKGAFADGVEFYGTDTISLKSDHWRHRERK